MNKLETIIEKKEELISLEEKINIILIQTNLSKEEASKKLSYFDDNHLLVIRDWLGIPLKSHSSSLQNKQIPVNINQQIFRQLRTKMNMVNITK
jgi:hypothetical protein